MTKQEPEPTTRERLSPSDVISSFTGFDEIAIENLFRRSFATMGESTLALRAAEFVVQRRAGLKDGDAYKAAMNMPFGDLTALYADEDGEDQGEASGPA